nr:hypothetical protein [Salinisphaera sp. G21_0]
MGQTQYSPENSISGLTFAKAPDQKVFKHDPVAQKTVNRVFKGGGFVVLKKEMPDPGTGIAENQGQND